MLGLVAVLQGISAATRTTCSVPAFCPHCSKLGALTHPLVEASSALQHAILQNSEQLGLMAAGCQPARGERGPAPGNHRAAVLCVCGRPSQMQKDHSHLVH
jgi:hypothetical protein